MNVAALELCKQLPLEWIDTRDVWLVADNNPKGSIWRNDGQINIDGKRSFPAPDFGYLLRKLPKYLKDDSYLRIEWPFIGSRDFYMGYFDGHADDWNILLNAKKWYGLPDNEPNGQNEEYVKYMSPESLAAALCIELIKQNIITPNQRERE